MSGTSRALSSGTPGATCQAGFVKKIEGPPPLARSPPAPVSFHTTSGMYDIADPSTLSLEARQYCPPASLNIVPPIAVTSGKLAGMPTAGPSETVVLPVVPKKPWASHPAPPESPEDATQVIPCAFACCAMMRFPTADDGSQEAKLSLRIVARF